MPKLVCIGGSTGASATVATLLSNLPKDFAAPVLVGVHLPRAVSRIFAMSLQERTPLKLHLLEEDVSPSAGHVYVGIGGKHIGVGQDQRIVVTPNPQATFFKPSLDVLFYTAARALGPGAIAVVLNGLSTQPDGIQGAHAVKKARGEVVALKDPANPHFGLPESIIAAGAATYVCAMTELVPTLVRLTTSA